MTALSNSAACPATTRRGVARFFAAVTAAVVALCDVIDEATDQSAAARQRYPSAD